MKDLSLYEFGGPEHIVRQIQKKFVPFFVNSGPVLDVGCGRGIFLELLRQAGIPGVGVDHSSESLAYCRSKGFEVHRKDAQTFLHEHKSQFGGIFCSHVIEHMEYDDAVAFLRLCYESLYPGGTLVLITPNPEDLWVISEIFWLDPTHVRPYPLLLLRSMLRAIGFEVRIGKRVLGHWRMIGPRNLLNYVFKRMLLGKHFGKPNTVIVAKRTAEHPIQSETSE